MNSIYPYFYGNLLDSINKTEISVVTHAIIMFHGGETAQFVTKF